MKNLLDFQEYKDNRIVYPFISLSRCLRCFSHQMKGIDCATKLDSIQCQSCGTFEVITSILPPEYVNSILEKESK